MTKKELLGKLEAAKGNGNVFDGLQEQIDLLRDYIMVSKSPK